jgi:putative aldouronate transport system substrate-binding protein
MKRIILVLVCLLAAAAVFAGGARQTGPATAVASVNPDVPGWTVDTSPVTLEWYVHLNWYNNDWGQYEMSQVIQEKTGVRLNFIIPAGSENEKLNTIIASGDIPDIVSIGWWESGLRQLIEGGLLASLEDLANQYDPYFLKHVANTQALGWYRQPDGKVYGYPNYSWTPEQIADAAPGVLTSNLTFAVQKGMYEAIGSPSMRRPDEFIAALQRVKERFPNVSGAPIIPFGSHPFSDTGNLTFGNYLMSFLAVPHEVDGRLYRRDEDPDYIEWLKTFRRANELGLLSTDIFIDERPQIEEKIAQGRYFSLMFQWTDFQPYQQARYAEDPNSSWVAIHGPANRRMSDPTLPTSGIQGWLVAGVSATSRNPDRAIRFLSYMLSEEGHLDSWMGIRGKHWDYNDAGLPRHSGALSDDSDAFNNVFGIGYWIVAQSSIYEPWFDREDPALDALRNWTSDYIVSTVAYQDVNPPRDSDLGVILTRVENMWGELLPRLLRAPTDAEFDRLYNGFLDQREQMGYADLMAYRQERVAENKAKLGLK